MQAVLITGSRSWTDQELVAMVVRGYELVIVGCCAKGADKFAREAATGQVKIFTADWAAEPRKAGILRNVEMVKFCWELGGVVCHAFWDGVSPGTKHCGRLAERSGILTTWHMAARFGGRHG